MWGSTFQMQVRFPELAVLRLKVMDEDWGSADDFVGSYSLPVSCLVPGYRHVHLTKSGHTLQSGSLFLHIQIQDLVAPDKTFVSMCMWFPLLCVLFTYTCYDVTYMYDLPPACSPQGKTRTTLKLKKSREVNIIL